MSAPSHRVDDLKRRERTLLETLEVYLPSPGKTLSGATVALVGAGAVNLIVALALVREGARVRILDAFADPRSTSDWKGFGSTFSGNDGRIFSMTEARQHHVREDGAVGESWYRRSVATGGWLCCPQNLLDGPARAWIDRHERIPGWLLQHYGEDILAFNVESYEVWQELQRDYPMLFEVPHFRGRLIRTYPTREAAEKAKLLEESLGSPAVPLLPHELGSSVPALADAVRRGEIGGALSVAGFSVNIRRFGHRLIDLLEVNGVKFAWQTPVKRIARDADGVVMGLETSAGDIAADHYVVSSGAYGPELLASFQSEGHVASVLGSWVTIPNLEPRLELPLKISRRGFGAPGAAEGANVIPGWDAGGRAVLFISSGHGYLGIGPTIVSHELVHALTRAARETAEQYFPDKYEAGLHAPGGLDERYCIRPWTPSGLGIFETAPTASGGVLVIAAAHNTGGFAQGPATGRAVVAALTGRLHPMQRLYHPAREQLLSA